jgi:hypothetical protein
VLEDIGCSLSQFDVASTDQEVRHHAELPCDWGRRSSRSSGDDGSCAADPTVLRVWLARGAGGIAAGSLLPPDDLSREILLRQTNKNKMRPPTFADTGGGEGNNKHSLPCVVVHAPWGPPLIVDEELAARLGEVRPGKDDDPRYLAAVDKARRWKADVRRAHDEVVEVLEDVRAQLAEAQVAIGSDSVEVIPTAADIGTLWHHPEFSPLDFERPAVLLTVSWRALRWFACDWTGERALRYALFRSDDVDRWVGFEPGSKLSADDLRTLLQPHQEREQEIEEGSANNVQ